MILFHGTSSDRLPLILQNGLLPRDESGVASNWEGDVESKPDLVYLTTTYPVYFAVAACEDDAKPVVLKVEVDETELFPDEDFLAKCLMHQERNEGRETLPLSEYNPLVDPRENPEFAEACLKHNGICAIERVLPEQIVDHIVLENDGRLMWIGADSAPIPMNYLVKGPEYRRYVEKLFDGGLEAAYQLALEDHQQKFGPVEQLSKMLGERIGGDNSVV